jgi:hypothetical protein
VSPTASVAEGDDFTSAAIEVHLDQASSYPVRVRYTTSDMTAIAGIDYQQTDAVVTFAPARP